MTHYLVRPSARNDGGTAMKRNKLSLTKETLAHMNVTTGVRAGSRTICSVCQHNTGTCDTTGDTNTCAKPK